MAIKFQRPRLFAFDSTTGEFLAEVRPEIDQAALNQDEINFLNPAFTTETAPPPKTPNLQAVWDGQQWNQVPDHRGDVWYTSVGVPVKVVDLGDPTALGLQQDKPATEPPEDPVEKQKSDLMVRLQVVTNVGAPMSRSNRKCRRTSWPSRTISSAGFALSFLRSRVALSASHINDARKSPAPDPARGGLPRITQKEKTDDGPSEFFVTEIKHTGTPGSEHYATITLVPVFGSYGAAR